MRILAAVLCLQLLCLSFPCYGENMTAADIVEVVGFGECTECPQSNVDPIDDFEGLRVTIDCKTANGEIKRRGVGDMDEQGKFTVSLDHEMVKDDDELKEECYARLHSASGRPCPVETSKVVFKYKEPGKHNFGLAGKLMFSPATCESAFLWHCHNPNHDHKHKHPPKPKLPVPKFPLPPKPIPPPTPVYNKPNPPPTPVYKKPLPPPAPVYKKPPVYRPPVQQPTPPPAPVYNKPPVYKPPVYKPPLLPPLPKFKKPCPPGFIPKYKKPLPPKPLYKPLPPIPKFKLPLPPPSPIYNKPLPPTPIYKPLPPPVPIYKKPLPPTPIYKPLPPIPMAPVFKKPACPPLPTPPKSR